VPKSEIRKARALVARFEARLTQHKQRGRKGQGRLLLSKAGKQAATGFCATSQMQEKKQHSKPWKQV
jgi:hypothetical protein